MDKLFIETTGFTREVTRRLDDESYAEFQKLLLANPDFGKIMAGCGGLRKIRLADPQRRKGKRGGARAIYLHVPEAGWILLLDIYDKGEKDDLSPIERKLLKQLADEFKAHAIRAVRSKRKAEES